METRQDPEESKIQAVHRLKGVSKCNRLTFDSAVNRGTGTSGRRYQGITLTVDGLNWVQMRRLQETGGRKR